MHSLRGLQKALEAEALAAAKAKYTLLIAIGEETASIAKSMVGHYQADWSDSPYGPAGQLSPMTIDRKSRYGLGMGGNPDTPLYETGAFKDSITWRFLDSNAIEIGSDDPKAKWLEYGTAKMVPRPIFKKSLMLALPILNKLVSKIYLRKLRK